MRLAPAPGLKVRHPRTRAWIPDEGVEVGPHDFDLNRMLVQGDLVEVAEPDPEAAKVETPPTPAEPETPPPPPAEPVGEPAHAEEGDH